MKKIFLLFLLLVLPSSAYAELKAVSSSGGGGSPGGSSGQIQYNNGGSFGGFAGFNLGAGLTTTQGTQNATPASAAAPNIYLQSWPDAYTTSSTVSAADAGGLSICNSTSSITLTLPAVGTTGFVEATPFNFLNENTGTCTIASSSSLVGASSFALAQYSSLSCTPDATKWNCAASGAGGSGAVSSVANSDSTLTISPTTGSVVASLNLAHVNTWTAGQAVTPATVTISTSTFTPNLASSNNQNITLVHASCPCTLANPTNIVPGQSGVIVVNQSSTGSDLISTYGSDYIFTNAAAPTLSTAANAVDELSYYVVDSTHIRISPLTSTAATPLTANTGTPTCGTGCTSITAGSTNARGSMVTSASVTSATVDWSGTLSYTPVCVISDSSTTAVADISAVSTSLLTTSFASSLSSVTVYWICVQ